jgi:hypothetical protein
MTTTLSPFLIFSFGMLAPQQPVTVTPAKAGAQGRRAGSSTPWIPASAGMTD